MCSPTATGTSTLACSPELQAAADLIRQCAALVIGAGAGLSASAGFVYEGARYDRYFADFRDTYGIPDMYRGMFHPFAAPEELWAYMSRVILINRYMDPPRLRSGAAPGQGPRPLCHHHQRGPLLSEGRLRPGPPLLHSGRLRPAAVRAPCCDRTWDNEAMVRAMVRRQKDMRVPADLLPRCPCCGRSLMPNLRGEKKGDSRKEC